jgi:hypothetical protein
MKALRGAAPIPKIATKSRVMPDSRLSLDAGPDKTMDRAYKAMTFLQKWRGAAKELGRLNALLYIIDRQLRRLGGAGEIYRYYFVAQPVPERSALAGGRGKSVAVRLVDEDDAALHDMPLTADVMRFRYGQGAICFGAFKNERMIGCLWLCLGTFREDEVRCWFKPLPPERTAWDFNVYVEPAHRLGPAFARLWDEANQFMRARGIEWSVSRISAFNPGSLAAHSRLGTRRLGSATFMRLGRMQVTVSGFRPYLHVSLGERAVPCIALPTPPTPIHEKFTLNRQ